MAQQESFPRIWIGRISFIFHQHRLKLIIFQWDQFSQALSWMEDFIVTLICNLPIHELPIFSVCTWIFIRISPGICKFEVWSLSSKTKSWQWCNRLLSCGFVYFVSIIIRGALPVYVVALMLVLVLPLPSNVHSPKLLGSRAVKCKLEFYTPRSN